ncbi:MFS transporter [Corynebacterium lowii]|uniref:Major Facilitator Superfamily protein n=1 Tax=Corynebacterium lowii TaxID=1544413 RepID=A0A0N8W0B4_9CORY|nr:MFS transporter [Corynebacterium lowii]KQB86226.1 Major Facilitator Superfamily protein [Corynebacterium lowii]MDP9852700.1 MFS family permease [Corynebacterium lowii]
MPHRLAPLALASAYFLSALCGSITSVAVAVYFAATGVGAWAVTGTLVAGAVAQIFAAPLLAPLFDRYPQKHIALASFCVDMAVLFVLIAWPQPVLLVAGTFISSATAGVAVPALFSLAEGLEAKGAAVAFSRMDTGRLAGNFAGLALGGLLVEVFSLRGAFLLEMAACLVSMAILMAFTSATPPPTPPAAPAATLPAAPVEPGASPAKKPSFLAQVAQAPALLLRNRTTRAALQSLWFAIIFTSLYNVALVFFAVDVLHAGGLGYAVLMQAFIVGRILGARVSGRLGNDPARGSHLRTLNLCGLVMGTGIFVAAVCGNIVIAAMGFFIAGTCNAVQVAALRLTVSQHVPQEVQPKALSSMGSINTSAMLFGYIVGAPVMGVLGPTATLLLAGAGTAAVSGVSLLRHRTA